MWYAVQKYVRKCSAVRGSATVVALAGVRAYESVPLYADCYRGGYSGSAIAVATVAIQK